MDGILAWSIDRCVVTPRDLSTSSIYQPSQPQVGGCVSCVKFNPGLNPGLLVRAFHLHVSRVHVGTSQGSLFHVLGSGVGRLEVLLYLPANRVRSA